MRLSLCLAALAMAACTTGADATSSVDVQLMSDMGAGDFATVQTTLESAQVNRSVEYAAKSDDRFDEGVIVASFPDVPNDAYTLTVSILDAQGNVIGQRKSAAVVTRSLLVPVLIESGGCVEGGCAEGFECVNSACLQVACQGTVEQCPPPPSGGACSEAGSVEACQALGCPGERECDGTTWGACEEKPRVEECNGEDDDCDGFVDEDLNKQCAGNCGSGTQTCEMGKWSACDNPNPEDETCDNADNDCDGFVDESITKACTGQCGVGVQACSGGEWQECSARAPTPETCNGQDDDCDDKTDEGLTQACTTSCGSGHRVCVGDDDWGQCNITNPNSEVVDNEDNDCDGKTDEGLRLVEKTVSYSTLGCSSASGAGQMAHCQSLADGYCRAQGFLGGFGPTTYSGSNATVACIGHGGGAVRRKITVAQQNAALASKDFEALDATKQRQRWGQSAAVYHCRNAGYAGGVGPLLFHGNGLVPVDVICLPSAMGSYKEPASTSIFTGSCDSVHNDSAFHSAVCTSKARAYCRGQGYTSGLGPLWIWGVSPVMCVKNTN